MGTAPLSVRVVTQLAGGGAPPSNSCHRPRQLSGLPRRRGPYSNHLHPGGIRIFRIFHKQTKTSSYQEQCSWHWFRRACHHARVGLALGQPPSARLTSVYAVSQRDFSFEFRLRDYFLLGGSLSENYFLRGGSLSKGFAYTHFPFSTAQCV